MSYNPYHGQQGFPENYSTPSTPLDARSPWEVVEQQLELNFPTPQPQQQQHSPEQQEHQDYQQQQQQQEQQQPLQIFVPTAHLIEPERIVPSQRRDGGSTETRRRSSRLNTIPEGRSEAAASSGDDVKSSNLETISLSTSPAAGTSLLLRHHDQAPKVRAHPYRRPQTTVPQRRVVTDAEQARYAQMGQASGSGSGSRSSVPLPSPVMGVPPGRMPDFVPGGVGPYTKCVSISMQ